MRIQRNLISRLSDLENNLNITKSQDILINDDGIALINNNPINRVYKPYPTILQMESDEKIEQQIIVGCFGSGKTSGIINYILKRACEMPMCYDKIRRYSVMMIRNTYQRLLDTTYESWLEWTAGLPRTHSTKVPLMRQTLVFRDDRGVIELKAIFLALDDPKDIGKIKSLNVTDCFINELSEIVRPVFNIAIDRTGRYPPKDYFRYIYDSLDATSRPAYRNWFPYTRKLLCDTNPPMDDHYLSTDLETKHSKNLKIYHQPPACVFDETIKEWINNVDAENIDNQPPNYWLSMLDKGTEYFKVYALGQYGTSYSGQPVYPEYNDNLHAIKNIEIDIKYPVDLWFDYGFVCPGSILTQFIDGRIFVIKEFYDEYSDICKLYNLKILPYLSKFDNLKIKYVEGDPANTGDGRGMLRKIGVKTTNAKSNKIDLRLGAVKSILNKLLGGKPQLIISKIGCPKLRNGFLGAYQLVKVGNLRNKTLQYKDQPLKTHPHSDLHDCLQYCVLRYNNYLPSTKFKKESKLTIKRSAWV